MADDNKVNDNKANDMQHDTEWILAFRQTFCTKSSHNKGWTKGVLSLNTDDPSAANYSILYKLEKFRNAYDNKFEFKLFWPNNADKACQHWKQTSNPADKSRKGVTGYEAVKINHTANAWGGLEWTANKGTNACLISGSANHPSYWYYALGTYNVWGANGGMPGPDCEVDKVELWVKAMVLSSKCVKALEEKYDKLRKNNIDESKYMKWGYEDITDWIVSLDGAYRGFEDVLKQNLKSEDVKGSHLEELDKGDLHRFGVLLMKDKLAILHHIKRLGSYTSI